MSMLKSFYKKIPNEIKAEFFVIRSLKVLDLFF